MLQKSTKIIAVIGTLFFIVSVTACGVFAYIVEKQKMTLSDEGMKRAQTKANTEALSSLVMTLEATREARAELLTRVIKEEDVIDLLSQIESIGKEQNAKLTTSSLTVEAVNETFETLVVQINVSGSYTSIMQVLTILEHLPYQSSVSRVQMVRGSDGKDSAWSSTFEVRVTKFKKI